MLELLHAAARGAFPPEDGRTEVVSAVAGAPAAVLSFTAHHVVAADVPADEVLARVDPADLKGPLAPAVLAWLSSRTGLVSGSLDVLLAWVPERGVDFGSEVRPVEAGEHPRVDRARRWPTRPRCGRCSRPASPPSGPRCSSGPPATSSGGRGTESSRPAPEPQSRPPSPRTTSPFEFTRAGTGSSEMTTSNEPVVRCPPAGLDFPCSPGHTE